jgi:hypothetical protein
MWNQPLSTIHSGRKPLVKTTQYHPRKAFVSYGLLGMDSKKSKIPKWVKAHYTRPFWKSQW